MPTPHFADEVAALFNSYSLRRTIDELGGDVLGTAYQAIVGATFRGELGAYFTPPVIADFMAAMVDLKSGLAADPASGTGTLLLAAEKHGDAVQGFGNDINPRMARAARLNYALRGKRADRILTGDGLELSRMMASWPLESRPEPPKAGQDWLSWSPAIFDAVFANPPFAGYERNPDNLKSIRSSRTTTGRTGSLPKTLPFLEVILSMLKEGAIGAAVIPTSVLNAEASSFRRFRDVLLSNAELVAIIGLPEAAFVYTDCGIHGALLFFRRTSSPREDYSVFVDWVDKVGYDRLGRPSGDTDFAAVSARFHASDWPLVNSFKLSELRRADRFDPNWLRHAQPLAAQHETVPLTRFFSVRNERVSTKELADGQWFRCFEVADADMVTGEVPKLHKLSGPQVRAKGRLRVRVRTGDILLPNHRDSLIARGAPTGRSAVAVTAQMDGAITSNRFVVLQTELPPNVARAILNSAGVRRQLVAACRGAASLDVREKSLDSVRLPLALVRDNRLAEIRRRADHVDRLRREWQSEVDALREVVQAPFGDQSDFRPASRQVM